MNFELELQKAIYAALTGDAAVMALVTGVYDAVPQADDAGSGAAFPYIVIGEDNHNEWDTDTTLGRDASVVIHTWSRYRGRKEVKEIQGAVYAALNRAKLTIAGFSFVQCDLLSSETLIDADELTRHGVQTFRVLFNTA